MGGSSQVRGELFLMNQAALGHYGYYHLLSGQDFLLRPIQEIQNFFEANAGREFLAVDEWPLDYRIMLNRIDKYHVVAKNRHITMGIERIINPLQNAVGIHRISNAELNNFAKGMNWASLTHNFVSCLLNEEEEIMKITSHSLCSDEIYKQIIFNKHKSEFVLYKKIKSREEAPGIPRYRFEVAATMHQVDWERGAPYVYRKNDFDDLIHSPYMFARKFSSSIDKEIIDKLYDYVTQNG